MGKSAALTDKFGQTVYQYALEAVADAGIVTQVPTNIGDVSRRVGMLIHRVEYVIYNIDDQLAANDDAIYFGLSMWDVDVDTLLYMQSKGLLDWNSIKLTRFAAAAGGDFVQQPFEKDFSTLPGGGKVCHPSGLYVFVRGVGTGAVNNCHARIWYTTFNIDDSFYAELFQSQVQHLIMVP